MWKDIIGWESLYEVSDGGYVRNKLTGKIRKPDFNSTGYERVCLYNKAHNPQKQRFFVHRLVATHFVENDGIGTEVNHKDCDIHNNSAENLEWVSKIENEIHSHKHGNKTYRPISITFNSGEERIYDSSGECARQFNVTRRTIANWASGLFCVNNKYNIKHIQYIN